MTMRGVYAIICRANGWVYIGATKDYRTRIRGHFSALRAGRHCNSALQYDFRAYGKDYFRAEFVEAVPFNVDLCVSEKSITRAIAQWVCLYNINWVPNAILPTMWQAKAQGDDALFERLLNHYRNWVDTHNLKQEAAPVARKEYA
jgi:hypothetical protein